MSYESINFLDTTPTDDTNTWALMNKGIEGATVAFNTEVGEHHYIADKNATRNVQSIGKALDVTQFAYKDDPTFEFIDDLFFTEAIGAEAETNILEVFIYRADDPTGAIPAKLTPAIIELGEQAKEGGLQLAHSYNVLFSGDSVKGTVVITEGTPVFTPETTGP